jgi:hypothetical protein
MGWMFFGFFFQSEMYGSLNRSYLFLDDEETAKEWLIDEGGSV